MKNFFVLLILSTFIIGYSACKKEVLAPVVITGDATDVQYSTATIAGEVSDNGGGTISEYGFYYSTIPDFAITDVGVSKIAAGSGDGSFNADLTGLSPNTTYYYKAYATNETETAYGAQKDFKTL